MAKSRRSRIDDVLEQHAAELDSLTGTETARVLQAYEDSRRELRERLAEMQRTGADRATPFTAQQVRVALAQVESGVASLRARMGNALGGAEKRAHDLALKQLIGTVKTAEPTFKDAGGKVELAALRRLAAEQGLALHQYSIHRYGAQLVEAIQRQIVLGVTQGMTAKQIADRIAGTDQSVFAGMRGRAELIARMELNRASNTGAQISLEEMAALDDPDTDDPLLKKADEFLDSRNHPFSRVLHGRAVLPLQEWEVPVGAKGSKGLVWAVRGNIAHGFNYPAHFGERGRQIPWRPSWGPYIAQPSSFRERGLKAADRRALRAIGRGEAPRRLSAGGRRDLQLSGFIDGQGRLLPAGRKAAFGGQKKAVVGRFDYGHEPAQAKRFVDVMGGGRMEGNKRPTEAGPDGTWTGGGRAVPVAMTRSSQADGESLLREVRKDIKKCVEAGRKGRNVNGLVMHTQCSGMSIDAVQEYLRTAPANQIPRQDILDRVILDFGGDSVLILSASGVTRARVP